MSRENIINDLHDAIDEKNVERVKRLVKKLNSLRQNLHGTLILQYTLSKQKQSEEILSELFSLADINESDTDNLSTPLLFYCGLKSPDVTILKLLIDAGAKVKVKDAYGGTTFSSSWN